MPELHELKKVGADYIETGQVRKTLRRSIKVPATTLFNCLADGPAWEEWLGLAVEWTSDEPRGEGTTRTLTGNGQVIEEYFFTWDEGERMAFRFDRATVPLAAFAEHYECIPVDDSSCVLEWRYAFEWGGPVTTLSSRGFNLFFASNGKRALKKLAKLLESDPARFA